MKNFILISVLLASPVLNGMTQPEATSTTAATATPAKASNGVSIQSIKIPAITEENGKKVLKLENLSLEDIEDLGNPTKVQIPGALEVQVLSLANNQIKKVPANAFAQFPNAQAILLHNNQIETIEKDALNGLNKLTWFDLDNNKLTAATFDVTIFEKAVALKWLNLGGNHFTSEEQTTIENALQGVKRLHRSPCMKVFFIEAPKHEQPTQEPTCQLGRATLPDTPSSQPKPSDSGAAQ